MPTGDYLDTEAYGWTSHPKARRSISKIKGKQRQTPYGPQPIFPGIGVQRQQQPYLTDVTPQEVKEREAQKRLKAIEAFRELANGKLPNNNQLTRLIKKAQCYDLIRTPSGMSKDGTIVMNDFSNLLETLRIVIEDKNENEDIQQFLFHARLAAELATAEVEQQEGGELGPEGMNSLQRARTDLQKQTTQAFSKIVTILKLLITSSDFRELLSDLNGLMQDTLSDFMTFESGALRRKRSVTFEGMSEREYAEQMERYGKPVGRGKEVAAVTGIATETTGGGPVESSFAGGTSTIMGTQGTTTAPSAQSVSGGSEFDQYGKPISRMSSVSREQTGEPEMGKGSSMEESQQPSYQAGPSSSGYFGKRSEPGGGQEETKGAEEEPSSWAPVLQHAQQAGQIFQDKLTPEARMELANKFRDVMRGLQDDPEYRDALSTLINLIKQFTETSSYVAERFTGVRTAPQVDANIKMAREELKIVLERFSNDQSLDPLMESFYRFSQHTQNDFYLRNYLDELRDFILRSLNDKDFLEDEDYNQRGSELIRRGRQLLGEKYKDDTSRLLDDLNTFLTGFQNDPITGRLLDDIGRLNRDIFLDPNGNYAFKTSLFNDFATVILPSLARALKFIPIPRIEHEDDQYHVIMTDIILTTENLLPNILEVAAKNRAVIQIQGGFQSYLAHTMTLNLYQIHAHVGNIPFYFRKKTGFPKVKEYGVAHLTLGGQGICAFMKIGLDKNSMRRTLIPRRVEVFIDQLDLMLEGTTRDAMYDTLAPMMNSILKTQLSKVLEQQILDSIQATDRYLTQMKVQYAQPKPARPTGEPGWRRVLKTMGVRAGRTEEEGKTKKWYERRPSYKAPRPTGAEEEERIRRMRRKSVSRPAWSSDKFDIGRGKSTLST